MKKTETPVYAPVILISLLLAGAAAIWHIGHNLVPQLRSSERDDQEPAARPPSLPDPGPRADSQAPEKAPVASMAPASTGGTEGEFQSASGGPSPSWSATSDTVVPAASSAGALETPARNMSVAPFPPPSAAGSAARLVETPRGRLVQTGPILFNSGMAELRPASFEPLDDLARFLKDAPQLRLKIIGHTDNMGVEAANELVSSQRAAAVKDYLVSRGIDASRLEAVGKGSADPIQSNDSLLGRQANRRIEFLVVYPK